MASVAQSIGAPAQPWAADVEESGSSCESGSAESGGVPPRTLTYRQLGCAGAYWTAVFCALGVAWKCQTPTRAHNGCAKVGSLAEPGPTGDGWRVYLTVIGVAYFLYPSPRSAEAGAAVSESPAVPKPCTGRPSRFHYLDNLKAFAIFLVVTGHTLCGWGGPLGAFVDGFVVGQRTSWFTGFSTAFLFLGESFLMVLLFFIAGYFTPGSYAKKGAYCFVKERMVKLGIPLLATWFGLMPLLYLFLSQVVLRANWKFEFVPSVGPFWFVSTLLVYTMAYVLAAGGPAVRVQMPTLCFVVCAFAIAEFLEILRIVLGFADLLEASNPGWGSGVSQTLAFYAGCVASQNRWLDALLELRNDPARTRQLWACTATVLVTFGSLAAVAGTRIHSLYNLGASPVADVVLLMSTVVCSFVPTAVLSVSLLDFFGRFANVESPRSKFFSEAAFGVYFIHPLVWPAISMLVVSVLECAGYTFTFECDALGVPRDYTELPTWLVFLGWFFTMTLSHLVLWPLVHLLRRLPCCSQIL